VAIAPAGRQRQVSQRAVAAVGGLTGIRLAGEDLTLRWCTEAITEDPLDDDLARRAPPPIDPRAGNMPRRSAFVGHRPDVTASQLAAEPTHHARPTTCATATTLQERRGCGTFRGFCPPELRQMVAARIADSGAKRHLNGRGAAPSDNHRRSRAVVSSVTVLPVGGLPMSMPRHVPPFGLAAALLLAACTTADKPPIEVDSAKAVAEQQKPARAPLATGRTGTGKPMPFVDDEAARTVYFASGEVTIDGQGAEVLRQNAQKLKEDPQLIVVLVGHTDNLGSPAYNLAVADRRTEAVSERLRSLGVPRNQIRRLPRGSEESSRQKCDSETCRRSMRRVDLVYERR
jgi:peptidoglycan-associated lipoprotein